ncbi:histidine kinase [Pseudoalteromonas tunicata]|uniref:sensor histidine kinase n=1 Tax=Pseudoalteromonas tunicata TaxID=314281 RepID=UPI00273DB2DF|nr:histidine kinase [Pseudoalteromonas tunicata]MDP5213025.1 histidine kinase [Pseudoalteromonas tunicata]
MTYYAQFQGYLLPSLINDRITLATLVVGQFLAIILSFSPFTQGDPWLRLGLISLFIHVVALISLFLLSIIKPLIKKNTLTPQVLIILLVINGVTSLATVLLVQLALLELSAFNDVLGKNLLIATILALLFVQFSVMHQEHNQAKSAFDRAELDALQARIRPHFLFNSLNTAAELVHHDAKEAEKTILALAALARAAMQAGKSVTLTHEIKLAQQYLQIEQWRLGNRLALEWQMPPEIPELQLPSLTIQPLLENAVNHGIEPLSTTGVIRVEMHITSQSVTIMIINPIAKDAHCVRENNGVAVANIQKRLSLAFADKASLTIHKRPEQYRVKLVLPLGE